MNNTVKNSENDILAISSSDQYRTVDELIGKSKPNSIYYTLLFLSAFIITAGILINNAAIVIGGMLVTPVLTPVLLIALGLSIGELNPIRGALILVLKSSLIIIITGFVLAFIFGSSGAAFIFENTARTVALYFLVAVAAGVAGTFAWARKDVIDIMPGIAIAVSLVPPLSLMGVGISSANFEMTRFNFLIFFFNLLGVIVGSLVVFSLLQFYKTKRVVQQKTHEVELEQHQRA